MMDINAVVEALRQLYPNQDIKPRTVPVADTFINLPPDCVHAATALLMDRFDVYHLSTITGQDTDHGIELLYHFWDGRGLTLRTRLPRAERAKGEPGEAPVIATLTDLIPGAAFYEREIWEMLGVDFQGHPNLSLFLLPEDWDDAPPLLAQTPGAAVSEDEADCSSPNDNQNEKLEDQESKQ